MFGELWPEVNIGQIYQTLGRLERVGLVRSATVAQGNRPDKRPTKPSPPNRPPQEPEIEHPSVAATGLPSSRTRVIGYLTKGWSRFPRVISRAPSHTFSVYASSSIFTD